MFSIGLDEKTVNAAKVKEDRGLENSNSADELKYFCEGLSSEDKKLCIGFLHKNKMNILRHETSSKISFAPEIQESRTDPSHPKGDSKEVGKRVKRNIRSEFWVNDLYHGNNRRILMPERRSSIWQKVKERNNNHADLTANEDLMESAMEGIAPLPRLGKRVAPFPRLGRSSPIAAYVLNNDDEDDDENEFEMKRVAPFPRLGWHFNI